jgi:hypothetical protein
MGDHSSWARHCYRPLATNPDDWAETCPACVFTPARRPYSVLLPVGFAWTARRCRERGALLPHPFTVHAAEAQALAGTRDLISVALSLTPDRNPEPPDVIRHRRFVEPGLSSASFAG